MDEKKIKAAPEAEKSGILAGHGGTWTLGRFGKKVNPDKTLASSMVGWHSNKDIQRMKKDCLVIGPREADIDGETYFSPDMTRDHSADQRKIGRMERLFRSWSDGTWRKRCDKYLAAEPFSRGFVFKGAVPVLKVTKLWVRCVQGPPPARLASVLGVRQGIVESAWYPVRNQAWKPCVMCVAALFLLGQLTGLPADLRFLIEIPESGQVTSDKGDRTRVRSTRFLFKRIRCFSWRRTLEGGGRGRTGSSLLPRKCTEPLGHSEGVRPEDRVLPGETSRI